MDEIMILPMITERDGVPVTTSRALADHFGKAHKDVLRAIETTRAQLDGTEEGKEFTERNFAPSKYLDSTGRELPMYLLTRDGFTLLAMGFTGARALAFKVAYINAFNRMEKLLTGRTEAQAIPAPAITPQPRSAFSERFLEALRQAIDSGRYAIQRKHSRINPNPGAEIIGVYDDYTVCVGIIAAHDIYEAATGDRVTLAEIHSLLANDGTITREENRKKRVRSINGRMSSTIRIPRSVLNRPL